MKRLLLTLLFVFLASNSQAWDETKPATIPDHTATSSWRSTINSTVDAIWDEAQEDVNDSCTSTQAINSIDKDGTTTCVDVGSGSGSDLEVENDGTSLDTAVVKLNFTGAGVTATEPTDHEIDVTIPATTVYFDFPIPILNPADDDDTMFMKASRAMTITGVDCIVGPDATTETVTFNVLECTSAGESCTSILTGLITCSEDGDSGVISDSTIASGNRIKIMIGAPTGSLDFLDATISGHY